MEFDQNQLKLVMDTFKFVELERTERVRPKYRSDIRLSRYPEYTGLLDNLDIQLLYEYITRTVAGEGLSKEEAAGRAKARLSMQADWFIDNGWVERSF